MNSINNNAADNVITGNIRFNPAIIPQASQTFGLTALKDVPADHPVKAGFRELRMIVKGTEEGKANAGKASQYCQLPEVTHGFATAFTNSERGMALVMDYIATLQNQAVRKVYIENGRSPCEADLSLEKLFELGAAVSENVRLTKESLTAWFELNKGVIAGFLATSRGAQINSIPDFWNTNEGVKYIKIAMNYKNLIVSLAERKPAFEKEVKSKLELVLANVMSGTPLEEKMLEKLQAAIMPQVDDLGL